MRISLLKVIIFIMMSVMKMELLMEAKYYDLWSSAFNIYVPNDPQIVKEKTKNMWT